MTNIITSLLLSNSDPDDKSEGNNVKENANLVSNRSQQDRNQPGAILSTSSHATNLVEEGILAGQRIAKISVVTLVAIGCFIFYHSYQSLVNPHEIKQPILTMVVLASAGAISLHRAFQMRTIANKYNLLSLKTDARNSIKDGSASVVGFFSVLVASQFGILQADAIGGMIIAGYIFSVSYISLKRSSLILVDAWENPKITELVKKTVEERFNYEKIRVRSVLLRSSGIVAQAEVHMEVDGNKPLTDVELLSLEIEMEIRSKIPNIERVSVVPHSSTLMSRAESHRRWKAMFGNKDKDRGIVR